MFVTLRGSLALLAGFLTTALLLTGLLTRRLILLAGLVLVRHGVSFHGNTRPTARRSGSFLTKKNAGSPCRNNVSLTHQVLPLIIDVLSRQRLRRVEPRLLRCDTASTNASSSAIIIRTHNHRPTNKREPVFRGNH
jgi:hypothetical protein